jgi:hypothetical protein
LAREIIKARIATGLLDFPFLPGGHFVILSDQRSQLLAISVAVQSNVTYLLRGSNPKTVNRCR